MPAAKPWRNRIVGEGIEAADQLLAHPLNYRIHPKAQQDALAGLLDQVGFVQRIIVNRRTGHVVDGHLRVSLAITRGESVPVVYVDLDEAEERLVLASLDPLAAMAGKDSDVLAQLMEGLDVGDGALAEMLAALTEAAPAVEYTQKIVIPIYEPTGPKPQVAELFDATRARALQAEIDAADVPDDLREFLSAAAGRHTVIHFNRVANFYAHSSPEIQALFEASALIIIDAEQAIERGFLKLHADVMDAFHEDYPDA